MTMDGCIISELFKKASLDFLNKITHKIFKVIEKTKPCFKSHAF